MNVEAGISAAMASSMAGRSSASDSSTPSTASSTRPSLTQEMNVASRPYHTHLNKAIMARLPLALPPVTEDPAIYARGIRHMLPVYHAFESAWAKYISVDSRTPKAEDISLKEAILTSALVHLHIPQLARADRLRSDLTDLLGLGLGELESWVMGVSGEESLSNSVLYDERERVRPKEEPLAEDLDEDDPEVLAASSIIRPPEPEYPELRAFVRHIHYVTRVKPHVILAYAFVFYMALFNGGRWIRAQLSKAREMWELSPKTTTEDTKAATENGEAGLSFWHFDGLHDGEDIKDEFKIRLHEVEQMLDNTQREDIVKESAYIFQACSHLVTEIDRMMGDSPATIGDENENGDMEDSFFIRSELMKPRADSPWGFLELMFRYMLPLGLFDLLNRAVNGLKRFPQHFLPMLRWTWTDSAAVAAAAKDK